MTSTVDGEFPDRGTVTFSVATNDERPFDWREVHREDQFDDAHHTVQGAAISVRAADLPGVEVGDRVRVAVLDEAGAPADHYVTTAEAGPAYGRPLAAVAGPDAVDQVLAAGRVDVAASRPRLDAGNPIDCSDPAIAGWVVALVEGVERNRLGLRLPEFALYLADAKTTDHGALPELADELVADPPRTPVELMLISTADRAIGEVVTVHVRLPWTTTFTELGIPAERFEEAARKVSAAGLAQGLTASAALVLLCLAFELQDGRVLRQTTIRRGLTLADQLIHLAAEAAVPHNEGSPA